MPVLLTGKPFHCSGCTFMLFFLRKETEGHETDTLIVTEMDLQSIVINTEIMDVAYVLSKGGVGWMWRAYPHSRPDG